MTSFRPGDERELAEIVAGELARGEPFELRSGGTKRGLGRPVQVPHVLDLGAFAGIESYEPEELVLTAGAATPLAEVERALAEHRQMLAFEPAEWGPLWGGPRGAQTLGGVVACNQSGPRRVVQGATRDHLLGFHAVNGRGEAFKAGGRVVKNVTGYDLAKLMAGSHGTLAALTQVTLKVLPAPEATRTLVLRDLNDAAAMAAMSAALGSPHEVSGAAHLPGEATALRLEGRAAGVGARAAALRDELGRFGAIEVLGDEASLALWRRVAEAAPLAVLADRVLWRVAVKPSAAARLVAALRSRLGLTYFFDWGGGLVWLAVEDAADGGAALIRAAVAAEGGGHATLMRGPDGLRAAVPVFEPLAPALMKLTGEVKSSFDPLRLFNRGRMYAEL